MSPPLPLTHTTWGVYSRDTTPHITHPQQPNLELGHTLGTNLEEIHLHKQVALQLLTLERIHLYGKGVLFLHGPVMNQQPVGVSSRFSYSNCWT